MVRREWPSPDPSRLLAALPVLLLLLVLSIVFASFASAQSVIVEQILFQRQSVSSADRIRLILPGQDQAQVITLTVSRLIPPGSDIATPPQVEIVLLGAGGNRLRLAANSRIRLAQGPATSTLIDLIAGSVGLSIREALDFFGVRHQRIVASVKGTEFTVGETARARVDVSVREGRVIVDQPAAAIVQGSVSEPELNIVGLSLSSALGANDSAGFDALAAAPAVRFPGRLAAEAHYRGQWETARLAGDDATQWRALDNLLTLLQGLGRPGAMLALSAECERLVAGKVPPDAGARCLNHRGAAHLAQGDWTRAAVMFEEAAAQLARLPTLADTVFAALVRTHLAIAWRRLGRLDEALRWHADSLAMLRPLFAGRPDPDLANALDAYAGALLAAGQFEAASREAQAALTMRRQLYPDADHPSIAASLGNLAGVRLATGNLDEALSLTQDSLAIWQSRYPGHEDADIATGLVRLGHIHERAGRPAPARQAFRRALAMSGRLDNDAPADLRAAALLGLARLDAATGNTQAAAQGAEQAVQWLRAGEAEGVRPSDRLLIALDTQAAIAYQAGRFDTAVAAYRQLVAALSLGGQVSPAAVARRADVLNNLGVAERARGGARLAIAAHEQALALRRSLNGPGADLAVAQSEANLARALIDSRRFAPARGHLLTALEIHRRAGQTRRDADHSAVLTTLALLDAQTGRLAQALRASEQALALQKGLHGSSDHPALAHGLAIHGRLLAAQGRHQSAWTVQERALAMMARVHPAKGHPEWVEALIEAAHTRRSLGDPLGAERLTGRAKAMRERLAIQRAGR